MIFIAFIFNIIRGHDCSHFGHGNSNKLALRGVDPLLAKGLLMCFLLKRV